MRYNYPCEWPIPEPAENSACPPCTALDSLSETEQERFVSMAIELLWSWTDRRFGLCEVTVRPCRVECSSFIPTMFPSTNAAYLPTSGWTPALIGGEWFNLGCGACGGACSCAPSRSTSIELPGPVHSISEIFLDGEEFTDFTLRNGILYRTDGRAWPECNDQIANAREPGSSAWEIVYKRGYEVPVGGQVAAYHLACELAKAACNDNSCQLPSNVRSVTRQGVSMDIVQTEFEDMKDGKTGIWLIDSWVASERMARVPRPAVYSPDVEPGRGAGTLLGLGRGRTRW